MNSQKLHDILDSLTLQKSTNERALTDKLYNAKNQRSSLVPKKSNFAFNMDKVQLLPKLPHLKEGATGKRGENEYATVKI